MKGIDLARKTKKQYYSVAQTNVIGVLDFTTRAYWGKQDRLPTEVKQKQPQAHAHPSV